MSQSTKTIGLALGSGGWRGLAHIGVIESLLDNGFSIGAVAGTSAGALIGGLYALWNDIGRVEAAFSDFTYRDLLYIFSDPAQRLGLVRGTKTLRLFTRHTRGATFADLKIPFRAVATDVNAGEPYVFASGDLAAAMRASSSVPLVFAPVEIDGRVLVDGGVSNPVPVKAAREMGVDIVVAVNAYASYFPRQDARRPLSRFALAVLTEQLMLRELSVHDCRTADLTVEPKLDRGLADDFRKFVNNPAAIRQGREAMDALVPRLKRLMKPRSRGRG